MSHFKTIRLLIDKSFSTQYKISLEKIALRDKISDIIVSKLKEVQLWQN